MSDYIKERITRRPKRRLRPAVKAICIILIFALLFSTALFLLPVFSGKSVLGKDKKLNAKTLEVPEYVDVQLIGVGLARKGLKLKEINDIVIHYTGNPATSAQNNRDYFNNIGTTVCSHFVIGLEGEIIQCVPLDERSAASNNRNSDTISIEVCHADESGEFSEATYSSLVNLTAWLCENSGLDESQIIRHYDITGKECPLYYVNNEDKWEKFRTDVKQIMES